MSSTSRRNSLSQRGRVAPSARRAYSRHRATNGLFGPRALVVWTLCFAVVVTLIATVVTVLAQEPAWWLLAAYAVSVRWLVHLVR